MKKKWESQFFSTLLITPALIPNWTIQSVSLLQQVLKSNWNFNIWTSIWTALSEKLGKLLQEINLSTD